MTLSNTDLDLLEASALAATPGLWAVDPRDIGARFNIETPDGSTVIAMTQEIFKDTGNRQRAANADYIAAAHPSVLIALVRELKQLRAAVVD
jgi:hypothetical protein